MLMKRIRIILILAAGVLMAACGNKEQKTIVMGHFASVEDAPEQVMITNVETDEEQLVPVTDGTFRCELAQDKTAIYELTATYKDASVEEGIIPDCDTVRIEIAAQTEKFYSDPNSLNRKLEDYAAFQSDIFKRMQTDPECYSELTAYAEKMYEENKDNYIGYFGFVLASQGKDPDEWEAMASQLSPELQQKQRIVHTRKVNEAKRASAVGSMFRDFEVEQPDGSVKHFSDYVGQGKYVLVDFWASWCGPCVREIPYIRAAYDKYNGEQFTVLGVAVSDEPEHTQRAISEHGIVWDVILNTSWDMAGELYGFNSIPTIMLFGPDGTLLVREGLRGDAIMDSLAVYLDN